MVKRRIYRLTRALYTKNWPKYLPKVVAAINNTPNAAIGFLRPNEIKSSLDDPKIDAVMGIPEDVDFKTQRKQQEKYEKTKGGLQVDDYVYLDFPPTTMQKGFDTPVSYSKHIQSDHPSFYCSSVLMFAERENFLSPFCFMENIAEKAALLSFGEGRR